MTLLLEDYKNWVLSGVAFKFQILLIRQLKMENLFM